MRFNEGKPKLSYLLSFEGGIEAAFVGSAWENGLSILGQWYRGNEERLSDAIYTLISILDPSWREDLARVSEFGAQKYARGNYLKGRSWSDTIDSLLRHISLFDLEGEDLDRDSKLPHHGHIAWNLLFLQHCVLTMPQFDDRLRAP
jgi:hypothetical protein